MIYLRAFDLFDFQHLVFSSAVQSLHRSTENKISPPATPFAHAICFLFARTQFWGGAV